jgi:hypothetical protein
LFQAGYVEVLERLGKGSQEGLYDRRAKSGTRGEGKEREVPEHRSGHRRREEIGEIGEIGSRLEG